MSDDATPSGSNTVAVDGFEITSNHESAEDMVKALTPADKDAEKQPRIIKPIPDKPKETDAKLSKAAARLGQAGGKAAAEKRAAERDSGTDQAKAQDQERGAADLRGDADKTDGTVQEGERPLGKPSDDPIARMRRAIQDANLAKRDRDAAIAELQRLRAQAQQAPQQRQEEPHPSQQPEVKREKPPFQPADFPEYEDYLDARDDWREQRWIARQQQAQAEARADYEAQIAAQQIVARVDSFHEQIQKELGDQYTERVSEDVRGLVPTFMLKEGTPIGAENVMADEVVSSENPVGVLLYLSEHPDVFERIASLTTPQAIQREMAKVEARVEAGQTGTAPAKGWTPAKPPVRPVIGSPTAADPNEVSDDMSDDEWLRRRMAKQASAAR